MTRETRKIQKVGGSTFSVSLPKSWARARDLEAGSSVTVYAHPEDVLVVQPGADDESSDRTVRVEHAAADRLEHVVRSAYAAGLDRLAIEAPETLTREQRRTVGRVAETLPGTAVVEEREDRMVVRVLLDGEEVSIRQSVRQLAFVATSIHQEAMATLSGDASPDAVDRGAEADRLLALVDRYVQRGLSQVVTLDALGTPRPELAELRATARELQQVAADARRLGDRRARLELDQRPSLDSGTEGGESDGSDRAPARGSAGAARSEAIAAVGERAGEIVETATDAVVTDAGADAARAALAERRSLDDELASIERDLLDGADDVPSWQALEHCRRTADHGATIAELALRGSLRREDLTATDAGDASGWVDEPPAAEGSDVDAGECPPDAGETASGADATEASPGADDEDVASDAEAREAAVDSEDR